MNYSPLMGGTDGDYESKNQITIEHNKIVVPALFMKDTTLS